MLLLAAAQQSIHRKFILLGEAAVDIAGVNTNAA